MVGLADLAVLGGGLNRPECVLAHGSGLLFTADWRGRGGVAVVAADGRSAVVEARGRVLRPNGIALEPGGTFLLAHLGAEDGGVFRLHADGAADAVLTEVEGVPLPPSNFMHRDELGRLWVTVSTRRVPRHLAMRAEVADGFVVLLDDRGARVVADGLGYTNECLVGPDGEFLYVNETFGRRLSRFPIRADGSLGARETVAVFGAGTFPDGLTFDEHGGIWITSIVSNRVIRVAPDGTQELVLEDADPAHVAWVEDAYRAGELDRPHLDANPSRVLRNVSSLAFGGPDLRTAHLGCLLGDAIVTFRSPIAGLKPPHWDFPLTALGPILAQLKPAGTHA
jgi:sugar lactone lactonase YvrE